MLTYELLGEGTPLFLSYSAADVEFALRLAVDLKNAGVYLWMDRLDAPSASWTAALIQARVRSAAVLVILSPAYVASSACQDELAAFQQASKPIYLLPVAALPEGKTMSASTGVDFSQWQNPTAYEEQFYALVDLLSREARAQVWRPLDADAQYITTLLGKLQAPHGSLASLETALSERVDVAPIASRPPPLLAQTDDISTLSVRVPAAGTDANLDTKLTALVSLDQVVSQYPSFILVAPAGAGKSYTLRSLVLDSLRRYAVEPGTVPLPLLVDLADWNADADVSGLIRTQWTYDDDPLELLAGGQLALYLDGLSENRQQPGFAARWEALQNWLTSAQAPQRVVITCDPADAELVSGVGAAERGLDGARSRRSRSAGGAAAPDRCGQRAAGAARRYLQAAGCRRLPPDHGQSLPCDHADPALSQRRDRPPGERGCAPALGGRNVMERLRRAASKTLPTTPGSNWR